MINLYWGFTVMKKRLFSLFLSVLFIISCSTFVHAKTPLTANDFKLYIKIDTDKKTFEPCVLRFNLFNENGEWLSNQICDVSEDGIYEINFPIGTYTVGTQFKLVATTGLYDFDYYGTKVPLNNECLMGTYAYRDENNELVICNEGFIETVPETATEKFYKEKHVNDLAVWSNTPYLIWVSKANYTVNVFYRDNGRWNLTNEFPCAIGAPSTPTVTGQFIYHQYQPKWYYDGYYVAPVMRFYGGYALHSTLIYDNGKDKDPRVGKRISLGCVRLRPSDITWLAENIPLDTKIYITEQ